MASLTKLRRESEKTLVQWFWRVAARVRLADSRRISKLASQKYLVNVRVSQGSFLGPKRFLLYITDHLDDDICNIANYADDIILYSNCDQASDLWQHLDLASVLEF